MKLLQEYNWTGNIRELRNVVERLVILSGKTITGEDVENYVMPKVNSSVMINVTFPFAGSRCTAFSKSFH